MIIDPRDGDAEDDASSTKSRSLLAIAGSLLAEISLPKLVLAWIVILIVARRAPRHVPAGGHQLAFDPVDQDRRTGRNSGR